MLESIIEPQQQSGTVLPLRRHLTMNFSVCVEENSCLKLTRSLAKVSERANKTMLCFQAEVTRINNFAGACRNPQFITQFIEG